MKSKEPNRDNRRIKVGKNYERADQIRTQLKEFCYFANKKIIPTLESLDLEVTLPNVLRYAKEPQQIKEDYINRELPAVENPLLNKMMRERLSQEFDTIVVLPARGETSKHPELLKLVEDEERAELITLDGIECTDRRPMCLEFDIKEVNELAVIYITDPEEIEAWERHQKATEALNVFFNGEAPRDMGENLYRYFIPDPQRPGYMRAAEIGSYKRFVKR